MRHESFPGSVSPTLRRPKHCALLLAAICGAGGMVQAQPPNDTPAGGIYIYDGISPVYDNSGGFAGFDGTPFICNPLTLFDVWFKYVVTVPGPWMPQVRTFSTCPVAGDTTSLPESAIEVFTTAGNGWPGVVVGCNENSCGQRSSITVGLTPGASYWIRVGSPPYTLFPWPQYVGGTFRLQVTGQAPANDDCAGAIPLGDEPGTWTDLSNLFSTTSTGVPAFCVPTNADVWYSWVASCSGQATFRTCGSSGTLTDTVLQVLTGTCGSLVALGCDNDYCSPRSLVTVPVVAGQTYYVRVGSHAYPAFPGWYDWGTFALRISYTGGGMGTFASLPTECGGLGSSSLTAAGSPTPGGSVTYTFSPSGTATLLWFGLPTSIPLCPPASCTLGATLLALFPSITSLPATVPCDPSLAGITIAVQGGVLFTSGGCPSSVLGIAFDVSNTVLTTIG